MRSSPLARSLRSFATANTGARGRVQILRHQRERAPDEAVARLHLNRAGKIGGRRGPVCEHVAEDARKIGGAGTTSCSAAAPSPRRCTEKPKWISTSVHPRHQERARQSRASLSRSTRGREKKCALQSRGCRQHPLQHGGVGRRLFRMDQSGQGRARRLGQLGALDGDAVEVFGPAAVQPSFVSGVEMARPHGFKPSTKRSNHERRIRIPDVTRHSAAAAAVAARAVDGAVQRSRAAAGAVRLLHLVTRTWYELYQKYRANCRSSARESPGLLPERNLLGPVHGAYGDYAMISENLLPQDIEEQINRRSVPFENLDRGASVS